MNKQIILYSLIGLFAISTIYLYVTSYNQSKRDKDHYENVIQALNDSITVIHTKTDTDGSKHVVEANLTDINNPKVFNTLNPNQKKFYYELGKKDGLIAAASVTFDKSGNDVNTTKGGVVNKDSICFKIGDTLSFKSDTSKKMNWKASVVFNVPNKFNIKYDYKLSVLSTFERQKDKSIVVKYRLDDPTIKLDDINAFIIPTENKSKLRKWFDNNRGLFEMIGGGALFGAGIYVAKK